MDGTAGGGIAIAREHDAAAYARVYRRAGRARVANFLEPKAAETARDGISKPAFKRISYAVGDAEFEFDSLPLLVNGQSARTPELEAVTAFVHGKALQTFLSGIVGDANAKVSAAHVTRYRPGDYSGGIEGAPAPSALAAFTIDFSQQWDIDWGGLHLFVGEDGNIAQGLMPEFNALTIFKLPQENFISQLTPNARERLGLVGLIG